MQHNLPEREREKEDKKANDLEGVVNAILKWLVFKA